MFCLDPVRHEVQIIVETATEEKRWAKKQSNYLYMEKTRTVENRPEPENSRKTCKQVIFSPTSNENYRGK